MTEIEELLDRLKELDPETWSRVDKVLGLVVHPRSPLGHYIIQGVLQEAIAARGWTWQVQIWNTNNLKFHIAYVVGGGRQTESQAETPAEALLQAYIAALEGEHGDR